MRISPEEAEEFCQAVQQEIRRPPKEWLFRMNRRDDRAWIYYSAFNKPSLKDATSRLHNGTCRYCNNGDGVKEGTFKVKLTPSQAAQNDGLNLPGWRDGVAWIGPFDKAIDAWNWCQQYMGMHPVEGVCCMASENVKKWKQETRPDGTIECDERSPEYSLDGESYMWNGKKYVSVKTGMIVSGHIHQRLDRIRLM